MKLKIQGIYKIKNCINGKVYIGQSVDIDYRWKEHKCCVIRGYTYPLYNSIRKYGIENFEFVTIEEVSNVLLLDEREQYWMDNYKSYNPEFGYNLRLKAESNRGYKHSKEFGLKISQALKGRVAWNKGGKLSDETRRKISLGKKGRKLKPHSDEAKLKISKAHTGLKHSEKSKLKISLANKGKIPWIKGKKLSEEHKLKFSRKGCKLSEEHKRKLSLLNTGRKLNPHSEETKRKLSEIVKLQWQNPEYRDKLILIHKKRMENPEIKAKFTNINKGRKQSDVSNAKRALTMKLKWQDPIFINKMQNLKKEVTSETRQKLSDATKKQWECPEIRNKMMGKRKVI